MSSLPLAWPEKVPAEKYINGADWSDLLGGATIVSVAAEVITGDVVITVPQASTFSGAVQSVWVSGGTRGRQLVRCTATLSDGRVLAQDFRFRVND